jgi:hypothetical protein
MANSNAFARELRYQKRWWGLWERFKENTVSDFFLILEMAYFGGL